MRASFRIIVAIVFALLVGAPRAYSASIPAASCSQSDVQAAVNLANNGDTVNVPAGSCTWTALVNVNSAIRLHGAGYQGNNITQISSGLANTLKFNLLSCSSAPELDGFLFYNTNPGGSNTQGVVTFAGTCDKLKMHDNKQINAPGGHNYF